MPNDDYIKRSEAVARLTGKACCVNSPGKVRAFATAINVIETMPAADVEPVRHGKWEKTILDGPPGYRPFSFFCSSCLLLETRRTPFCPHCGAKMDAELPKEGKNENAGL